MRFVSLLKKIASVSVITSAITFLVVFCFSIVAEKQDFGMYSYYQSLILIAINIIPFGTTMSFVVMRYKCSEKEYASMASVALFYLLPTVLIVLAGFVNFLSYFTLIDVDSDVLFYLLIIAFSNSICLVVIGYYRASQKFKQYTVLFISYILVSTCVVLASYIIFENLTSAYKISSFATSVTALLYLGILIQELKLSVSVEGVKDKGIKAVKYGFPIVLSSVTMSFLVTGDKLIIGRNNPEDLSYYSAAALISSIILFLVNNFASAWGVYLSKYLSEATTVDISHSYQKNKKKLLLIIPITISILILQLVIYELIYSQKYKDIFSIILVLSISYSTYGVSKFYMGYMNYFRKNFAVFLSSLIGMFLIITSCIFIYPIFGLIGVACSVLSGMSVQLLFCYLYTEKMLLERFKCFTE